MTEATDHDLSNMGRCDVCGEPVDMRDEGDELVIMENAGDGEFDDEAIAQAMARALRRSGKPEDYSAAKAYEEDGGFMAHEECYQKTSIPDFPTMEPGEVSEKADEAE